MVIIYYKSDSSLVSEELKPSNQHLLQNALWIDLLCPTKMEEQMVEDNLKLDIPSKEEIQEIELSSRLYTRNNILYMTATMVALADLPEVTTDAVTFILTDNCLITLRYVELQAFRLFREKLLSITANKLSASALLMILLDAAVDRLADIIEKISHKHDEISQSIFRQNSNKNKATNYKKILQQIGSNGDLVTKVSESLMTFFRLLSYLKQAMVSNNSKALSLLSINYHDINALQEHANFLSTKFNFLLDATLGMINIEQNNIIKIFSVAAVIFLPPTLIASIYGMNFNHMPELSWHIGYPLAILMMIISAWLPFRYFKKKKWL